jgi:organic radical activating enzyme
MDKVPTVTQEELKSADTICLTGGDPFLYSELQTFINRLREQYPNIKNLYAYTSGVHYTIT